MHFRILLNFLEIKKKTKIENGKTVLGQLQPKASGARPLAVVSDPEGIL
jgi:hypothetical protein